MVMPGPSRRARSGRPATASAASRAPTPPSRPASTTVDDSSRPRGVDDAYRPVLRSARRAPAAAIWLGLLGVVTLAVTGLLLRPRLFRFDAGVRIREAACRAGQTTPSTDVTRSAGPRRSRSRRTGPTPRHGTGATSGSPHRTRPSRRGGRTRRPRRTYAGSPAPPACRCRRPPAPPPSTPTGSAGCTGRPGRVLAAGAVSGAAQRRLRASRLGSPVAPGGAGVDAAPGGTRPPPRPAAGATWRAAELAAAAARSLREEAAAALVPVVEERESVLPLTTPGAAEQTREIPAVVGRAPVAAY